MIDPGPSDLGRAVVYYPPWTDGWPRQPAPPPEDGVITSFNQSYVFVRYNGDSASKATRREDLQWAHS